VARGDTTALDAYLTPVLQTHVARMRSQLGPRVDLKFMQSHGGLTDAERFLGKDAVFSGPAGGVVACAHIADLAGLEKVIGFDMGGTSTDVSRYDGSFERVHEAVVAGVRIQSPMLNIVTVAAGGGSILRFQDGRFRVGPDSAGADPGPTCYRRGGPTSVTDANLVLGRLQAPHFPSCFGPAGNEPIDIESPRRAFAVLAEQIRSTTGKRISPEETAMGFLRIANENMARAIREISVMRGYDVRDYAMVCFGGAGAQHACAIASSLGIRTILLHPLGGVMSAYGMGLADVIHAQVESLLVPFDDRQVHRLSNRIRSMTGAAEDHVRSQGIESDRITHVPSLDLRYQGVETALNVPLKVDDDLRQAFEDQHRRLFGLVKPGHPMEIVNLRLETCGATRKPREKVSIKEKGRSSLPLPIETALVTFEGFGEDETPSLDEIPTPVYRRVHLTSGNRIEGPALIVEDISTAVVEPGWRATTS
jgi:5-oxoprolinase (ATP-hydrolysing)